MVGLSPRYGIFHSTPGRKQEYTLSEDFLRDIFRPCRRRRQSSARVTTVQLRQSLSPCLRTED